MYKLCIFAGTTEGRELVELLSHKPVSVTACVATDYGRELIAPAENVTVSTGRLDREDMEALFSEKRFDLVIDATHPYAPIVTENVFSACEATKTEYLRLVREDNGAPEDAVFVPDTESAAAFLAGTEGNIFLTTGSKELHKYTVIPDLAERAYARVLPMDDSLRLCREAGFAPKHIIAMQGPFSREINEAMLKSVSARWMVTKEGGTTGGFDEKIAAAASCGVKCVVIGRPPQLEGKSISQVIDLLAERFGLEFRPSVTVVGIGPGAKASMTREVRDAVDRADCLIGAQRMLDAVKGEWQTCCFAITPQKISEYIASHREHRRFAVVMSGDSGFFSGTKKLLPMLSFCDVKVLPGLSSLSVLCARLGASYEDVVPVSIHGRDHDIAPDVRRCARVFALVGGEDGMTALCRRLTEAGLGSVRVSVGERLSYPDEKVTCGTAEELQYGKFHSLSVALIENDSACKTPYFGLPDSAFLRGDGEEGVVPMTKSEVRAVCLSKLRIRPDSICWDVGAGTGSVSIEMASHAMNGAVYAIEKKDAAVELLTENKEAFHADNLHVISGSAPEACRDLPAPSHVFIGGSSGNLREIVELALHKNPAVRIVATAITLESVSELTQLMTGFSGGESEVVSLTVARGRTAGRYHLMTGQNPIYIFTLQKGQSL